MNILGFILGTLVALSVMISGCGSITSDQAARAKTLKTSKSSQAKVVVSSDSIQGIWNGDCVLDPDKYQIYKRDVLEFMSDAFSKTTSYYFDSNCSSSLYTQTLKGADLLEGETIIVNNATVEITPQSSIITAIFNQTDGFCKVNNWEVSKAKSFKDVTVCAIPVLSNSKIERYGNNELFIGDQKFLISKKTTELQ